MSELYDTLGIGKKASKPQIKKAYRDLAKKHHPDRKGGDVGKFQELQKAYMVLYDDKSREQYDRTGTVNPASVTSELSEAYTNIANLFTTVVEQSLGSLENINLVEVCREQIFKNISESKESITKLKARAMRLKLAEKRLSKKKKLRKKRPMNMQENILEGVLLEQLANCDKNITFMEKKISMCKVMSILIEDYNYKVDPQQTEVYTSFSGISITTL